MEWVIIQKRINLKLYDFHQVNPIDINLFCGWNNSCFEKTRGEGKFLCQHHHDLQIWGF